MQQARTVLIAGGVRSGKSAFALARARELGERRTFIATAVPFDDEMRERRERHRAERADEFRTLEEPRALVAAIRTADEEADVIVVDCLTLWLSNLLLDGLTAKAVQARVEELCACLRSARAHVVLVSNEVGLGIVPDAPLARTFRDVAGHAHQAIGRIAHELYFAVMGQLLRLRPAPLELVGSGDGSI